MILNPKEMIGIVDIRSLGYYKIKQGILQQNLSKYYRFEEASKLCEYFNRFVDTLKKDREQTTSVDKCPLLNPDDERRNMTDREILEKYIDLGASCFNKEERLKIMDMTNDIFWSMERKQVTAVIGLDMSAAFNTIDHDLLLDILCKRFGMAETALQWYQSYLRP